jgi:hypothetical protein
LRLQVPLRASTSCFAEWTWSFLPPWWCWMSLRATRLASTLLSLILLGMRSSWQCMDSAGVHHRLNLSSQLMDAWYSNAWSSLMRGFYHIDRISVVREFLAWFEREVLIYLKIFLMSNKFN